ncbi:MAG TPA: NUDIX hydrolase [Acidimicrobiales bacterium]|nr:NUDIX hydrolase [Acidimicrobiales bacterium]
MSPGRRAQSLVFAAYKRLPRSARLFVVRRITPSFHVGSMCVVERADGHLLLVRQSYRRGGWGFPGGLLRRGEEPPDAARREVSEELGIDVELQGPPVVVVDARARRVDVIFTARLAEGSAEPERGPHSPEIADARWFPPDGLPSLLPEATSALIELGRSHPPR